VVFTLSTTWKDIILLETGEHIITSIEGEHEVPASRRPSAASDATIAITFSLLPRKNGHMVFTNRRIFFVEKRGFKTKTYAVVLDIRYEDIIGVSAGGTISKHLAITDKAEEEHRFHFYAKTPAELVPYIKQLIDSRQAEIEKEKTRERIQIIVDFSFLKSVMQKGGVILQTIVCPFCGASVQTPDTGNVFKCSYCRKDIYALDVFQKIRELIRESANLS